MLRPRLYDVCWTAGAASSVKWSSDWRGLRRSMQGPMPRMLEWSQATAKQRVEGNAKIDRLQAQLQILESSVKERQAEHDNILEGMALSSRR